ncbi:phosphatase PAP2 family protein [Mesorhizobium sp. M1A.F.Ca.IN.020.06.1.1]|uniref:phosphatase PAP2/dual specificity phosphatase family protein n=3 Tax=Mesorhizobium TaxID=68287 RepID=UPI000FCBE15D|nr:MULTISPECIES: phosphatase PAP2/dual specificity phosphatase family protein [unclassified Mesorhizobium]RUV07513.1 phosphatase PAP2 family protein [Mesorhizobium sp. M1A.F.Ca.IN.020.03.2.1]RUV87838.1 phosphatase PAP2 family protein [Mesorhizobium sp. M1A.F.Ca.IN.020.32.1.1]RUW13922.1 phosphatase PAP2 family protein [Mesorhizobium sp. M1A.F.Ca.IN.022.05.2.1]RUW35089.1 phosphatase PAP2 family protein [Mesorhizobium sp. M1A.F.Ca.IN.020.06.1.1]RWG96229.1 MAG: phosphatase PAP2 family protein [Mes
MPSSAEPPPLSPSAEPYGRVVLRAALWLAFLAPFFYSTYGFANWLASTRDHVGSIVFSWEHHVPFVAWTIVPYWSINLFYGLSLLLNDSRQGVDRLAGRYLTAQIVAVACFILFPLTATFVRPETSGLPGFLFAVLGGFDKPFNQAPSLHIALLVIIWDHWRQRLAGPLLGLWHGWCFLIGASVLTTWQHHFIDIPTGALLGFFALWLFPAQGQLPFAGFRLTADGKAWRLALYYALGAALALTGAVVGVFFSALALLLLWPSLALAIVAFAYAGAGAKVFQKAVDGRVSLASRILLWPYRLGARVNVWAWTRKLPPVVPVSDGVFLGRFPNAAEADGFGTVIDLAAELERPGDAPGRWQSFGMLDLLSPPADTLDQAVAAIEPARRHGTVLVCCALGFQRSATVIAGWLVASGRSHTPSQARKQLAASGRPVHLQVGLDEPA